jgi:(R,R)-butanediol dehydrogenase/meso-butanediol dehydrogenase/diacetyl reductase
MKALRWHAVRDVRLDEVSEPSPRDGEVKVKVKWCGICGGDINAYDVGSPIIPTQRPHPRTGKTAPVILGHEFSGEVVEAASGAGGFRPGERVVVRPTLVCYQCHWCRRGQFVQCASLATIGLAADGAFAPYVVAPADCVYRIPDQLSDEIAAFCEPVAVAVHAVKRARIAPGDTVAVIGAGPIGLLVLQAARACGAGKVFVVEPMANRRELARELGATEVLDPREGDAGKAIGKLTDNRRVDVSFECAGPPAAMVTAAKVCQRGGTIVAVGVWETPYEFPFAELWMREQTIVTSQGYADEFPVARDLLADGRIRVQPMITARIRLDDIGKAFQDLTGGRRDEFIKILVSPE